ncbi:MAG: GNAT family N-acetyltransferase [Burkholderiaceae bacterium]|nr:GNAT family N-acetyltransferase [Burkholderiaceae bacterium]
MTPLPRHTPRTTLRRLAASDLDAFHAYRSDAEVGRYQGWTPMTREQAQAFLAEMSTAEFCPDEAWFQLAIAERASGRLIGDIGICVHTGDDAHAEIGFTLAPQAQHQGLATEAVRAAVAMLFEHTAIERVIAITDARNIASLRLLERVNMSHVRTMETLFRGEPCTELLCELRRPVGATG